MQFFIATSKIWFTTDNQILEIGTHMLIALNFYI